MHWGISLLLEFGQRVCSAAPIEPARKFESVRATASGSLHLSEGKLDPGVSLTARN